MEDNKAWEEGMYESLEVAIAEGNYVECEKIIQRVRDEGFDQLAKHLKETLKEETIGTFIHETDARIWK